MNWYCYLSLRVDGRRVVDDNVGHTMGSDEPPGPCGNLHVLSHVDSPVCVRQVNVRECARVCACTSMCTRTSLCVRAQACLKSVQMCVCVRACAHVRVHECVRA